MDWTVVYYVTVLVAIALLAIVITIFVLASSLLGLAVESAAREEEERRAEQDGKIEKQVERARTELDQAAKGTGEFERAQEALKTLVNEKKEFEKETKRRRRGYEIFTTKGGILYPGIPLLISLVLSGLAWGLGTYTYRPISLSLWGVSVAVLGFSFYRIYFGLKRIEAVAVTSEQAALTRMTSALGMALEKHDDAVRPELSFVFEGTKPPFHCKKEATLRVKFDVELVKGDMVQMAEVWFFAPQGFTFPSRDTWSQDADFEIPSACTCKEIAANLLPGVTRVCVLEIKCPAQAGAFTLGYTMHYAGCKGKREEFEVVVE